MALSVREALTVPALAEAHPEVLASSDHLDRPVRWVHVVEQTEVAHLLNGGELLLTTGLSLATGARLRRHFLRQAIDSDASGLVIELGTRIPAVPADMVQIAADAKLPLVALGQETRFVEVTEQVHRAIIDAGHALVAEVERLNREFNDLVLSGADVSVLLQHLSRAVGNAVILEDSAHQVVDLATPSGVEPATLLAQWQHHSRHQHRENTAAGVHQEHSSPPCLWSGIWLRHQPWGRVHILGTSRPLDELTRLLLDRAGLSLSLALLARADAEQMSDRAASTLLDRLMAGDSPNGALSRAQALGSDLTSGTLIAVTVDLGNLTGSTGLITYRALSESALQHLRQQLRSAFGDSLRQDGCGHLTTLDGDRIRALIAVPTDPTFTTSLEQIVGNARDALAAVEPDLAVTVGASRPTRPEAVARAFEESRVAADFARHGGARSLYRFAELGAYPLLVRLAQGPELAAYVESQIGPLLQHDSATQSPLLPTLRAFLGNAGRKADTVRALHIQRRTLYARLTRLRRILDRNLDDQDTRTELTLALQGLTVLNQRD